jgi:hypothetical protein
MATLQSGAVPGVFESSVLDHEAAGDDDESSVEGLDDFEDILVSSLTPVVRTWGLALSACADTCILWTFWGSSSATRHHGDA